MSEGKRDGGAGTQIWLQVNGRKRWVREGTTITGLLEQLDFEPALVVVERNREIVERKSYERTTLADGDSLELVHFVGGGTHR